MIDVTRITKSLEDSNVFIDCIIETVKHEINKGEILPALLAPLAALVVQPVISPVVTNISGRGVLRAGRGYIDKKF